MLSLSTKGLLNGRVRGGYLTSMVGFGAFRAFFLLGYDPEVMSGTITEPFFNLSSAWSPRTSQTQYKLSSWLSTRSAVSST
ncbi:hypothetical protein PMIN02_004634 [Paraphaeosphaeria minitans]|uniref:Uncharacterized protein n=1 Tax=Paraphaeosphaeria minitans TaxID=565426 RepID=A0A9P6GUH4_9PLEO|nr:hypothetical protein PMIN01_00334 [Paraphaeosphaeria minitans]